MRILPGSASSAYSTTAVETDLRFSNENTHIIDIFKIDILCRVNCLSGQEYIPTWYKIFGFLLLLLLLLLLMLLHVLKYLLILSLYSRYLFTNFCAPAFIF